MKLLILTQKIDINYPILGFFHRWVEEFSKHCEKLTVIALSVGKYKLPENVKVLSLGKEKSQSKLKYLFNFYKYIWQERNNYDNVFVHMNKEYVLLGGIFWRPWNKKIALWYNHGQGNIFSVIAGHLAQKIFYTSPFSFFAKWKKAQIMPVGIDTNIFKKDENIQPVKNSILYLGRISPVKNVHILIEAVNLLDKKGSEFILNIVGEPGENDIQYFEKIKNLAKEMETRGKIKFWGKVANYETPRIYNQNEIAVNLTDFGSFDKVILEAMSCGLPVLTCNEALLDILGKYKETFIYPKKDYKKLAEKIEFILKLNYAERKKIGEDLRNIVVENHSVNGLITKILKEYDL